MRTCAGCGSPCDSGFGFCPWCATPQRTKIVGFFRADEAHAGKALRVSRYLRDGHVRFSVWNEDGTVEATVSIPDAEAERLAAFLVSAPPRTPASRLRGALRL